MDRKDIPESGPPATPVVVVGASAGGLAAIKSFLSSMPGDCGAAIVYAQHLDPTKQSKLPELLRPASFMPVEEARNGMVVEPNRVYLMPAQGIIRLRNGRIHVEERSLERARPMSIDYLFESCASEYGAIAIGVLLSGGASDGTIGLRAIREAGGITIAQDPREAEHPNMPTNAINQGVVDLVLPIAEMPKAILDFINNPVAHLEDVVEENKDILSGEAFEAIKVALKTTSGFDVSLYKSGTVSRRIARRMRLTRYSSMEEYAEFLQRNPEEISFLLRDMMVGVTEFFRDRAAFRELERAVLPALVRSLESDRVLRIWVPGCSTGEEAYSLAMIAEEAIAARPGVTLQILATDLDEASLQVARRGLYPLSVSRFVPEQFLTKYFDRVDAIGYQIKPALRDKITFAPHNLLADPPFANIDLVSCRNVLIYLRREVQEEVLKNFHFALQPGGVLFLGTSESLGEQSRYFSPISKKWRLYRRIGAEFIVGRPSGGLTARTAGLRSRLRLSTEPSIREVARVALLESVVPPSVIISAEQTVLYLHGDLRRFFELPSGEPRLDLTAMMRRELRARVQALVYRAQRQQSEGESTVLYVENDGHKSSKVRVTAKRITSGMLSEGAMAIIFEDVGVDGELIEEPNDDILAGAVNDELNRELISAREDLRTTVEELETSNEELKASNEEAMSMNEELQSANEELEVSAEELRSLNDEITAVNAQLFQKVEELERANDDLQNFFASTRLATLFFDSSLKVKRLTPAAAKLLGVSDDNVPESVESLQGRGHGLIDKQLESDCRHVLDALTPLTRELKNDDQRWFQQSVLPYRTRDNRIEGVVVTYFDITKLRTLTDRLRVRERQQSVVARLGVQAAQHPDISVLMQEAVRFVSETLDVPLVKVLKLNDDGHALTLMAGIGWGPAVTIGETQVPGDLESQAGFTLLSSDPIIVSDLREETRFSGPKLLHDANVISGISCIIQGEQRPFGVIGAHTASQREFSSEDTAFLQSIANVLAGAIRSEQDDRRMRDQLSQIELVYSTAPVGLAVIDEKMRFARVNHRFAAMNGLTIKEHTGKTVKDVTPTIADVFEQTIQQVLDAKEPVLGVLAEGETNANPGRTRYWISDFYPLHVDGHVPAVNIVMQDITSEQQADRRIVAEHRMAQILSDCESFEEAMPCAVQELREALGVDVVEYWEKSPGGAAMRLVEYAVADDASDAIENFISAGRRMNVADGQGVAGRIAHAQQPKWYENISGNGDTLRSGEAAAAGLRTGFGFPLVFGGVSAGVMLFYSHSAWEEEPELMDMMRHVAGDFVQFLRRVKSTRDLQTSEIVARRRHAEIDHIYRTAPIGLCFCDRDLRYLKINETLAAINGRSVDDHIGRTMAEVLPDDLLSQILPAFDQVLETDEGAQIEVTAPLPSDRSQLRTWNVSVQPVRNNNELQGINVVVLDITERLKVDQEIREHEQRLRLATTASEVGIWSVNVSDATVHWTPEVYRIAAMDEDGELTLKQMREMVHPDELDFVTAEIEQALQPETGGHIFFQTRIVRPTGETRWIDVRGEVFFEHTNNGSHRPVRAIGTVIDTTDRVKADEHQKLLVRELSHRVKNILATVTSIASQTKRQAPSLEVFSHAFEGRLVALGNVHGLLLKTEWRGASLRMIIEQTIAPYKSIHAKSLDIRGDNVLLTARAATVLSLVFHELVTNAVKYGSMLQERGRVRLHWKVQSNAEYGLIIEWEESNGPPVTPPERHGFGTTLITDGVQFELDGKTELEYRPEGLTCVIKLPYDVIHGIIPEPDDGT